MDFVSKESRPCTRKFLDTMIQNPSVNCSKVFKNMTSCLHNILFSKCFDNSIADDPSFKPQLEQLFNYYARSIASVESAFCSEGAVEINATAIQPELKSFIPCKEQMFEEGPICSKDFVAKFKASRNDSSLCGLYSKAKHCETSVVKKYCRKEIVQLVDPYNPFCKKVEVKSNQASRQTPGICFYLLLLFVYMIKLVAFESL
ncbi:hypothetical protein AC249_AIPGENE17921 [Exaiptasia diaphana]|nr:hypothetical protein AC249_AIPGENE17921 [Exaiptasia diaphana]